MTHFLVLLLVILGAVVYFMNRDERTRFFQVIVAALRKAMDAVALEGLQCDLFFDALRARTPRVIAMPLLIVVTTAVFARSPLLGLCVNAVCVWQVGLILERLVGRLAFTTVYVASAVAAAIVSLSVSPDISAAAPGSVLGMYGLLLITTMWGLVHRSALTIPLNVMKRLAPVAAVFVLYQIMTTGLSNAPALAALFCGVVGGIVVARDVPTGMPAIRRLATAMTAVVTVVTLYAVVVGHPPTSERMDVRQEIDRVIAVEARTARLYEKEVDRFRRGRITATALADVIEKAIVPELQVVAVRLRALPDVPLEHQHLFATADKFLKMRDESWRLRAMALHKSDMLGLRQADSKELASRDAFHLLSTPLPHHSSRTPPS